MECKDALIKIIPFIRNKLPDEEQAGFILHVKNCQSCMEELRLYYTVEYMLNNEDVFDEKGLDIKLNEEISERVAKMRGIRRKRTAFTAVILLAELVLLFSALLLLLPDSVSKVFPYIFDFIL